MTARRTAQLPSRAADPLRPEEVREQERRDLARLLHDELGQLLTGIRLEVAGAVEGFRTAGGPANPAVIDRLQAAVGLVDLSIATIQRMTSALRPPVLEHLTLVEALQWEASVFRRRTGIRCRVSADPLPIEDRVVNTVLYRILLEALTNVARHARAGAVTISLRQRGGTVTLQVRDNGRGIPRRAADEPSSPGLTGMRERARSAGGELRVERGASGGTVVIATLPVPAERQRPASHD